MNSITDNTDVTNIAITGVGGQGVLTLSEILAKAALKDSHNVRVGEIHGMAQRGGHVVCTVRIGEKAKGPIVDSGTADLVVGFELIISTKKSCWPDDHDHPVFIDSDAELSKMLFLDDGFIVQE